jgi:gas vesicle protein
MINENLVPKYQQMNILGVLAGLMIGSLAGAVTMLLLAPQSGKDTRKLISEGGRKKFTEIKQQSQDLVVEQLDHVSEAALAGKKAIQTSSG